MIAHHLASAFGLKPTVLDPAPAELSCASHLGIETQCALLEHYDPGERRFDVVTMCQTIDHLTDASASLGKVRQLLSPDGVFFVDIVDLCRVRAREGSLEGTIKIDHPFYFTEPTTEAMLARHGLRFLQKSYGEDGIHVGYICGPSDPWPLVIPTVESVRAFFEEVGSTPDGRN